MTEGLSERLKFIAGLLAVSVPLLYAFGYMFHLGYLSSYGIDHSIFPLTIEGHLINAFWFFATVISDAWRYLNARTLEFILIGLAVGVFALLVILIDRKKSGQPEFIKKLVAHKYFKPAFSWFFGTVYGISIPYIILFFLLFVIGLPLTAHSYGKKLSQQQIERFLPCLVNAIPARHDCTFLFEKNKVIMGGELVYSSESYVAIYNGKQTVIENMRGKTLRITKAGKLTARTP